MSNRTFEVAHSRERSEIIIETIFMILIFLIGAIGNPLTGFMIMRNNRLRNLHNTLTINLIIADSIAIFACMPPIIVTFSTGKWLFGGTFCNIIGFFTFVLGISCLWTILWLSITRLAMLTKPNMYAYIIRRKYMISIVISIWVVALFSAGSVYIKGRFEFKPRFAVCFFVFDSMEEMAFFMTPLVIAPLLAIALLTAAIGYKMTIKNRPTNTCFVKYREKETEIIKTYIILVAVYILCYIPVFVIEAEAVHYKTKENLHHIFPVMATYLGLLPFSLKTVIHVMTRKAFRNGVFAVFKRKNRVGRFVPNLALQATPKKEEQLGERGVAAITTDI
eukprot:gene3293-3775_t